MKNETPEIYVLRNGIYSIVNQENKIIKTNIPKKIIDEKFNMYR